MRMLVTFLQLSYNAWCETHKMGHIIRFICNTKNIQVFVHVRSNYFETVSRDLSLSS